MSVVAAGVMCYLTMDKRLIEVLKSIALATYQPFLFLIVIDFVYSYPTLSKIIHCLVVSLTCTKFNEQIQDFAYTEQMVRSYARKM